MPFGYKNGPSIFQRIMQNILAPFLWIFTLVYIDDIVIFSLNLEDHISHLNQVFKAIEGSGVTLSVTYSDTCDFGLAAILQQVQRIQLKDLKRTKAYKHCERAFKAKQPIPALVVQITKLYNDVPKNGNWGNTLDETWVYIEKGLSPIGPGF